MAVIDVVKMGETLTWLTMEMGLGEGVIEGVVRGKV